MRERSVVLAGMLLVVAACDDTVAPPPDPGPAVLAVTVRRDSANSLIARALVRAVGYDSAAVRFWSDTQPPQSSPWYPVVDSTVTVPVLGMRANRTYQVEVIVRNEAGSALADTQEVVTGALPDWIPAIGALGTDTVPGVLLLSLPDGAVAVANDGAVVWYRAYTGGVLSTFQAHPNGQYTMLGNTDTLRRFRALDETGVEVATIACIGLPTRFHAVRMAPDGSAWLLCDDERVQDLSAIGGEASATVTWTVLQHVSADGTVLFTWHSGDHFALTDIPVALRLGPNVNATHGNAIEFDRDGGVLLSFRSLNEVTKIDPGTGAVVWRLGGLASDFVFANDVRGGFFGQHGARVAVPGQLQLLDNGAAAPSRLVRYQLDPDSGVALLVMDARDGGTFTPVGGATQVYADGRGLVTFGRAGRVFEVDPVGRRTWELTGLDGQYVFRAQRLPSPYGRDFARSPGVARGP